MPFLISTVSADTIHEALGRAYLANPQLNAQRANTRAVDENLPQARGQFLPQASGSASVGVLNFNLLNSAFNQSAFGGTDGLDLKTITNPVNASIIVNMNIFNGFRGVNGINTAQAQIHQSRQLLRNSELTILGQAATAYMNVLRETAVYDLRTDYVRILENQVTVTKDRLAAGEATMTDVNQALQFLSQARADKVTANTSLRAALAVYKQIIQSEPVKLASAAPMDRFMPKTLTDALREADAQHPTAIAARYNVDINEYAVKIAEGTLAPTVDLQTRIGQDWNYFGTPHQRQYQAGGYLQLRVPIYEGGVQYSQIRQAKEKLGESRLLYDQQINQIHQQLEATWAAWKNSETYLRATREQVKNAEAALEGLREELKYGQRTTWDILYYQQTLVNARVAFVTAQRDRIITSYNVMAAIGILSANTLNIDVPKYEVTDHYDRVKNQFIGLEPWK